MAQLYQPKYVGKRVLRKEDPKFLTGRGRYIDDINFPSMLHAKIIRSTYAHAKIRRFDCTEAAKLPGVVAVFDNKAIDTNSGLFGTPCPVSKPLKYPVVPFDRVRYVGEPLGAIVACDQYTAEDALELVQIEYEPLKPITSIEGALASNSPRLYEEWEDNIAYHLAYKAGDLEKAFSEAKVVASERLATQRHTGTPIETRGVVAKFDPWGGMLEIWTSNQWPFVFRSISSPVLGLPENRIQVYCPDVGGGFGCKQHVFREEVLIALVAKLTSRPIKWIQTRTEDLTSGNHAREQYHDVEVAFRSDGRVLGIKDRISADLGTGTQFPWAAPPIISASFVTGPYDIQCYEYDLTGVVTNKASYGAYRGFGQPNAVFVMERMLDIGARKLGLSRVAIRDINLIKNDQYPYTTVTGAEYDSGSNLETFHKALELIDYQKLIQSKDAERARGRLLGIGIACYVEGSAANVFPASGVGGVYDSTSLTVNLDGKVTLETGLSSQGQGLETTLAQVVSDSLGLTPDDVSVSFADTRSHIYGLGAWGSRGAVIAGGSAIRAGQKMREKIAMIASMFLEARLDDLEFADGRVFVRGVPDKGVTIADIAKSVYFERFKVLPNTEYGLHVIDTYDPGNTNFFPSQDGKMNACATYSNATHAAVVEVDRETGSVKLLKYAVVEDCGTILNPNIVDGQIQGGVAQGLGGALLEEIIYDSEGQLVTPNFLDYLIPTASDVTGIAIGHVVTPSKVTVNGIKGAGEGGTIPTPAVIAGAVEDAILQLRETQITRTPLKPEVVWAALNLS